MGWRKLSWPSNKVERQLPDEDRRGLEMDALVVEAHENGPGGLVRQDRKFVVAVENQVLDDLTAQRRKVAFEQSDLGRDNEGSSFKGYLQEIRYSTL